MSPTGLSVPPGYFETSAIVYQVDSAYHPRILRFSVDIGSLLQINTLSYTTNQTVTKQIKEPIFFPQEQFDHIQIEWAELWHSSLYHVCVFLCLLTVHPCTIPKINPTRCTILLSIFISLLYMFRANMCPSSGEITVSMWHWYLSLCVGGVWSAGWSFTHSNQQTRSHPYRVTNTSVS
jgi:hypothetical protein